MRLAIIGAGVAGLAAARALRLTRPDIAVTVYEKSRGVGGRAATRRVGGYSFDHGAQYLKAPTAALAQLVTETFAASGPVDIVKPVYVFDREGRVAEGDPAQNAEAKWTWPQGISALGKALGAGVDILREVRVAHLEPLGGGGFALIDADGDRVAEANAVLLTPPGPQTAAIVAESALPDGLKGTLLSELDKVAYRACLALTYAYGRQPDLPWYAAVNTDRQHPIAWLACEHAKPGRVADGSGLLIAQLAPGFSAEHYDAAQAGTFESLDAGPGYLETIHGLVEGIVGAELGAPRWVNLQRWRYALPDGRADFATLNGSGSGLFFAGDYTAGLGRVHLAIEEGWRVAELIARGQ